MSAVRWLPRRPHWQNQNKLTYCYANMEDEDFLIPVCFAMRDSDTQTSGAPIRRVPPRSEEMPKVVDRVRRVGLRNTHEHPLKET